MYLIFRCLQVPYVYTVRPKKKMFVCPFLTDKKKMENKGRFFFFFFQIFKLEFLNKKVLNKMSEFFCKCHKRFFYPYIMEYNSLLTTRIKLHLAKLIPQRFLKPAVCKYPTTVNNSEIYILLPKPCPWMWHLICGNRARNGSDRKPEIGKTHSLKLALFKNPIGAAL